MIGRIRTGWRLFAAGRPGLRFRERYRLRYRLRRSKGRGGWHPARLAHLAGGAALIVASAFFGWLPVLGWGTILLGLGMIAGEFYPAARLLDRLEVSGRRTFGPAARAVAGWPAWARLSVSLALALAAFGLVYGLYRLAFGG